MNYHLFQKDSQSVFSKKKLNQNQNDAYAYVIVIVPLSGSDLIRISRSPASPSKEGSVTLKNLNLSKASLALLEEERTKK